MTIRSLWLGLVLVACTGEPSLVPSEGFACIPAEVFCVGSRLWTCTYSGKDATGGFDCAAQGTPTNPGVCGTGCPNGEKACCRRSLPVGEWNFSRPELRGNTGISPSVSMQAYKTCGVVSGVYLTHTNVNTCPASSFYIQLSLDRKKLPQVGVRYTFPTEGLGLLVSTVDRTVCSDWKGTVRIDSDLPQWGITIDAACAEVGKETLQVVGSIGGNE